MRAAALVLGLVISACVVRELLWLNEALWEGERERWL